MRSCFSHIGHKERDLIAKYRAKGWSFRRIGEKLGRSKSSIVREYNRNLNEEGEYLPSEAHSLSQKRKSESHYRRSKCEPYAEEIYRELCLKSTPEQIAVYLSKKYCNDILN